MHDDKKREQGTSSRQRRAPPFATKKYSTNCIKLLENNSTIMMQERRTSAFILATFLALLGPAAGFLPRQSQRQPTRTTAASFEDSLVRRRATNANEIVPLGRGSTVAIITPFDDKTGKIDFPALQSLLNYHLQAGTTNLCILGTTGEASVLSMEEREQVLTCAVDMVKGRIPIMAGTGTIDPNHVKEMTLQAADLGCDAALIVTPYYVKPPQAGLIQHFITAANIAGGLPVVIYNVPGRTGVNMSDESIATCAQHDNIVAVKDATGDLTRVGNLKRLLKESNVKDFLLYSGDDGTTLDFLTMPGGGGDGCISVTANVAAKDMATMVQLALQGKKQDAQVINERLMALHKNLFCESNPMPAKWAAQRLGLINSAYCRPPLLELTNKASQDKVEEALRLAGLLE